MLNILCDQLGQNIDISESLKLPQSLHDRFVDSFLRTIKDNPLYKCPNKNVNFINSKKLNVILGFRNLNHVLDALH